MKLFCTYAHLVGSRALTNMTSTQSLALCIEEVPCSHQAFDSNQLEMDIANPPGPHGTNAIAVAASATSKQLSQHHRPTRSLGSLGDLSELALTPWGMARRMVKEGFTLLELAVQLWTYLGVGESLEVCPSSCTLPASCPHHMGMVLILA